jgi:hypothetical protein
MTDLQGAHPCWEPRERRFMDGKDKEKITKEIQEILISLGSLKQSLIRSREIRIF